jgi:hypothetical protein
MASREVPIAKRDMELFACRRPRIDLSEFRTLPNRVSEVRLSDQMTDAARAHSLRVRGARRWWETPAQFLAAAEELLPAKQAHDEEILRRQRNDRRASFAG